MRVKILTGILLLCSFSCGRFSTKREFSQVDTTPNENVFVNECEKGIDSAKSEALRGNHFHTTTGLIKLDNFGRFYHSYLKRQYNVTMRTSCTGYFDNSFFDCFSRTANRELELKYGTDFFDRTRKEAEKLFKK